MMFGIGGLDSILLKSATLSNTLNIPYLDPQSTHGLPLVRVAIEPKDPRHLEKLIKGLKMLNAADGCLEVFFQETGELVLVAAGELHLERCLADLDSFCGVEVSVSAPIVMR